MSSPNNIKEYFITDYFDIMHVQKISPASSLSNILNIIKEDPQMPNLAAQSYTMYFSEQMQAEYEGSNNSSFKYRKNPFDTEENDYLSIIQVHISPEVLSRIEYNASNDNIIIKPFIDDIYSILNLFKQNCSTDFAARVYLLLSAGDLAVVIRSPKADISYKISSCIRRRTVKANQKDFAIYKTYTLLALPESLTASQDNNNKYILRGCYSFKYWANQEDVQAKKDNHKNSLKRLEHLNGRYDFSVEVTEDEFRELLPLIKKLKKGDVQDADNDTSQTEIDTLTNYLEVLLKSNYISYINERYLMTDSANNIPDISSTTTFNLKETRGNEDFFGKNLKKINDVLERYRKNKKSLRINNVNNYRKRISQYLDLIEKLMLLCIDINELSETRIYAAILIEQLEAVVKPLSYYFNSLSEESVDDIQALTDTIEGQLRKAVYTTEHYAGYIRNNNLQSLQTPNYNIESTAGMEKILIGYGELISFFIKQYTPVFQQAEKKFLPVVVPNLQDEEFSVEVLFPGNDKKSTYTFPRLMVIDSPTIKELTDVSYMIPILFHEIAHQFRYEEKRSIRNKALLDSVLYSYFSVIAEDFANEIICIMKETCDFASALKNGLKKAFIVSFRKTEAYKVIKRDYLDYSFEEFIGNATYILREWYVSWTAQISLMGFLNDYIGKIKNHFSSNETIETCIQHLYDINDHYVKGDYNITTTVDEILKIIEKDINKDNDSLIFKNSYNELSYELEGWLKTYSLNQNQSSIKSDELEKFIKNLYSAMQTYWVNVSKKCVNQYMPEENACTDYIPSYHYWTLIGRWRVQRPLE